MVRWYHLIISAYGFWLPNDPRGSWSDFVRKWELLKFGPATKVTGRRSYAHDPHDIRLRKEAKHALQHPPVRFSDRQRQVILTGFAQAVEEGGYPILTGCVGHDHAHVVVARHERWIEQIATHLKSKSTMALRRAGCHPLQAFSAHDKVPSPWARKCWSVFINEEAHLHAAIDYVSRHPLKEGLPLQTWSFLSALSV